MTALEMMDPKMDAGMRCNKNKTPPLTFETAVESGKLKLDDLTSSELIGIMDSMLACFVSWLEGHSLAQTVYTCLYMHDVNAIGDTSLKAFCFGMNNSMRLVKDVILAAAVYEEEDFQPMIFPHPLEETSHEAVFGMLKQAEENLIRATKSATDEQADVNQAVINRLKYVRFFMDTLHAFYEAKVDIDLKIVKQLNILSELLGAMKRTQDKGTQKEVDCEWWMLLILNRLIDLPPLIQRMPPIQWVSRCWSISGCWGPPSRVARTSRKGRPVWCTWRNWCSD